MSGKRLAIIGGTGLDALHELTITRRHRVQTPFGKPSAEIQEGSLFDYPVLFLPRHGDAHDIPPHKINYRANIWALSKLGVGKILAITAVGGIAEDAAPQSIIIPEQLIDYTYGREHTFFDGIDNKVEHIDFTSPFCHLMRSELNDAANQASVKIIPHGVYGATQGPRLETAAEIKKLARDGCTIVGMTVMPEASLSRELELSYANCSIVVNWGAGIEQREITMSEIRSNMVAAHVDLKKLLAAWLKHTCEMA
mgnify:CR=1 FL=1